MGDTHARWGLLNTFINDHKPRNLYILGDFGYWENEPVREAYIDERGIKWKKSDFRLYNIKNGRAKIFWCDGNHEQHHMLKRVREQHPFSSLLNTPIQVAPNIFYCPRGTVLPLEDGRRALFMGGAMSIDKHWRTPGKDWFPEEVISYRDLDQLYGPDIGKIDVLFSHTCPESFLKSLLTRNPNGGYVKINDPSCVALEWILETFKPSLAYFGHWHTQMYGYTKGCHWTALNMLNHSGYFERLK